MHRGRREGGTLQQSRGPSVAPLHRLDGAHSKAAHHTPTGQHTKANRGFLARQPAPLFVSAVLGSFPVCAILSAFVLLVCVCVLTRMCVPPPVSRCVLTLCALAAEDGGRQAEGEQWEAGQAH